MKQIKISDTIIYYPVIITKTSDKHEPYYVSIPNLKGHTEGKTTVDAFNMAKDYIATSVLDKIKDHEQVPHNDAVLPAIHNHKKSFAVVAVVDIRSYQKVLARARK